MAKPNYSFEKRQRELAKKKKQEAKEARKREARETAAAQSLEPATQAHPETEQETPSAGPRVHLRPQKIDHPD